MDLKPDHAVEPSSSRLDLSSGQHSPLSSVRLWRCDADFRVVQTLFTPDPDVLVGLTAFDFLPREQAVRWIAPKELAFLRGAPVRRQLACTWYGREGIYDVVCAPDKLASGRVETLTCVSVEITGRGQLMKELFRSIHGPGQNHEEPDWQGFMGGLGQLLKSTLDISDSVANVLVDASTHSINGPGGAVRLTGSEWLLLQQLLSNKHRVVPRELLIQAVWGPGYEGDVRLLHDMVSRLRHAFVEAGCAIDPIETFHRVGYRLITGEG
jgi:hypothetical protein